MGDHVVNIDLAVAANSPGLHEYTHEKKQVGNMMMME